MLIFKKFDKINNYFNFIINNILKLYFILIYFFIIYN